MLGRRGGQRARERSLFCFFSRVPTLPVSRVAGVGSAQIALLCWVGGVLTPNPCCWRQRAVRGPNLRPILIFARHCLLPDVGHLVFAPAPSSRQSEPARAQRTADPATTGTLARRIAACGGGRAAHAPS